MQRLCRAAFQRDTCGYWLGRVVVFSILRLGSGGLSGTSGSGSTSDVPSPRAGLPATGAGARVPPTLQDVTQAFRNAEPVFTGASPSGGAVAESADNSAASDVTMRGSLDAPQRSGFIDQVFVRAQAQPSQDVGLSQVVAMEVGNLPQRDGERCNIEFSFEVGVDNVRDVISEMQRDLNLALSEADTKVIEDKIDFELQRCGASDNSWQHPAFVLCNTACHIVRGAISARQSSHLALAVRLQPVCGPVLPQSAGSPDCKSWMCRAQQARGEGGSNAAEAADSLHLDSQASGQHVEHSSIERPLLQRTSRSAFESAHGTRYSVSLGEQSSGEYADASAKRSASRCNSDGVAAVSAPINCFKTWHDAAPERYSESNADAAARVGAVSEASTRLADAPSVPAEGSSGGWETYQQVRKRLAAAHAQGLLQSEESKTMRNGFSSR
jgi:hypothetical protein